MSSRETTPDPQDNRNEEKKSSANNSKTFPDDVIDMDTFEQILEMDDEDDREFSYGIVTGYFDQFDDTYVKIEEALKEKNMKVLSELGHFLKGSSAAIGLQKVHTTCEKIQYLGKLKLDDEDITEEEALKRITPLIPQVKKEHEEAKEYLQGFYNITDDS